MKKQNFLLLCLLAAGILMFGCQEEEVLLNEDISSELVGVSGSAVVSSQPLGCSENGHLITFDNGIFQAGDIVSEVTLPGEVNEVVINVMGTNPELEFRGVNAAMIFDTNNPTGDDEDLGTPNELYGGPGIGNAGATNTMSLNNVLIISEDLISENPDDANLDGAFFEFDFSPLGTVTMQAMDLLDVDGESQGAFVKLFDSDSIEIFTSPLPETGDNGYASISLGPTSGVASMIVLLNGSGAIDNICFEIDKKECKRKKRKKKIWNKKKKRKKYHKKSKDWDDDDDGDD